MAMSTDSAMDERQDPTRTCVGCRKHDAKEALLRFAVAPAGDALAPDVMQKLGGRGVSVHPTRACLKAAVSGGFARSLRHSVNVSLDELVEQAVTQYERRAEGLLVSAHKARRLAVGTDAVRESMGMGTAEALVIASDAAGRREDIEAQAKALGQRCVVFGTKVLLGGLLGREEVGVLTILDKGIASALVDAVTVAAALREAE